jgi:uncharacterized protein YcaQ
MLRRVIQMTGKASNSPFDRGLVSLQRDFKITPVGVAEAGAWRYSFVYDLVHRHYPDLPEQARQFARGEAQARLVQCYFDSVGAATKGDVQKLFQWRPAETERALEKLVADEQIMHDCLVEGEKGNHYALTALL